MIKKLLLSVFIALAMTATTHAENLNDYPFDFTQEQEIQDISKKFNTVANPQVLGASTFSGETCPSSQTLTQNLRVGAYNGKYHPYTGGVVTQANILQDHLNRLGFNSGISDGKLGPVSQGAIERMQSYLGVKVDGIVGPQTREALNNSCGITNVVTESQQVKSSTDTQEVLSPVTKTNTVVLGTPLADIQQMIKDLRIALLAKKQKTDNITTEETQELQELQQDKEQESKEVTASDTSKELAVEKKSYDKKDLPEMQLRTTSTGFEYLNVPVENLQGFTNLVSYKTTGDAFKVGWNTTESLISYIIYSDNQQDLNDLEGSDATIVGNQERGSINHGESFDGLQMGTTYYFRIIVQGEKALSASDVFEFQTAPEEEDDRPVLSLDVLKGFPDLWGEGADEISGGRDGIKFFITSLGSSNTANYVPASNGNDAYYTGTFNGALRSVAQPKHIIPRISGRINHNQTLLYHAGSSKGNYTYHGHLAPEGGLYLSSARLYGDAIDNAIFRFLKYRSGNPMFASTMTIVDSTNIVFDNSSLGWFDDEVLSLHNDIAGFDAGYNILQNNIFGQNIDNHNTAIIFGNSGTQSSTTGGTYSIHNNFFGATSHRTPNVAGGESMFTRVYNNVTYNHGSRLSNLSGGPTVDSAYNYHKARPGDTRLYHQLNKVQGGTPSIWTAGNFVTGVMEDPEGDNKGIWTQFFNTNLLPNSYFRSSPLPIDPNVGYEPSTAQEAYERNIENRMVGANRSTNSNGEVVLAHDSVDVGYFNAIENGTQNRVSQSQWTHPTIPSTTPYADTNWNGIYDGFELEHNIQDADQIIDVWEFEDYIVENDAGYDAFEMWSAYIAGDFERLLDN